MSKNNTYYKFPVRDLVWTLVPAGITAPIVYFLFKLSQKFVAWGANLIPTALAGLIVLVLIFDCYATIDCFKLFLKRLHVYILAKKDLQKAIEYDKAQKEKERKKKELENQINAAVHMKEYDEAIASQQSIYGKHYFTEPCPYCGHLKVRLANWDDKRMSVAFWGAYSSKIGKAFQCDFCKRTFNR